MKRKLLLLAGLSLAAASCPIGNAVEELTPIEVGILLAAFLFVIAVQSFALWVAAKFADERLLNILIAVLFGANAYHFAFLTLEAKTAVRIVLATLAGVGAWGLVSSRVASSFGLASALVFSVLSFGHYAYERAFLTDGPIKKTSPGAIAVESDRNVYLISSESLHSPKALRQLYGIERTPHADYLRAEGFRVLDNSYSVDMSTRRSYQRMMEFSHTLSERDLRRVFNEGNASFSSFRAGNYKIQFIYISNYMNLNHSLVDHAYPKVGFYICDNLRRSFFYIPCRESVRQALNRLIFDTEGTVTVADEIAHLKERISIAAEDDSSWLTISHIAFPNHTALDHRFDDTGRVAQFRTNVARQQPNIAQNYREIVSTIKARDPEAVIVTFGDHGKHLTRGMETVESNRLFSADDFIEDRFGAFLAVYPADFCKNRIFEGSSTGMLVKSVILCLNGNDAPTREEKEQSRSVVYLKQPLSIDALKALAQKATVSDAHDLARRAEPAAERRGDGGR